jgi:hypothetical protein
MKRCFLERLVVDFKGNTKIYIKNRIDADWIHLAEDRKFLLIP